MCRWPSSSGSIDTLPRCRLPTASARPMDALVVPPGGMRSQARCPSSLLGAFPYFGRGFGRIGNGARSGFGLGLSGGGGTPWGGSAVVSQSVERICQPPPSAL
jgi:hypothetical protein